MNIIFQMDMRVLQTGASPGRPGCGQKGVKKERTVLDKQVEYLGSSWT